MGSAGNNGDTDSNGDTTRNNVHKLKDILPHSVIPDLEVFALEDHIGRLQMELKEMDVFENVANLGGCSPVIQHGSRGRELKDKKRQDCRRMIDHNLARLVALGVEFNGKDSKY